MTLTLASLLDPPGIVAGAAFVTSIVALLKGVFPSLTVSGALMAFVLSAVLYVLAGVSAGAASLDAGFAVFVSWVACATGAVGINGTYRHVTHA